MKTLLLISVVLFHVDMVHAVISGYGGLGETYVTRQPINNFELQNCADLGPVNPYSYTPAIAVGTGCVFTSVAPIPPPPSTNSFSSWYGQNVYVVTNGHAGFAGLMTNVFTGPTFFPMGAASNLLVSAGSPAFAGLAISNQLTTLWVYYAPPNAGANTTWTDAPTLWLYAFDDLIGTNFLMASNRWSASVIGQPTLEPWTNWNWVRFDVAAGTNRFFRAKLTP